MSNNEIFNSKKQSPVAPEKKSDTTLVFNMLIRALEHPYVFYDSIFNLFAHEYCNRVRHGYVSAIYNHCPRYSKSQIYGSQIDSDFYNRAMFELFRFFRVWHYDQRIRALRDIYVRGNAPTSFWMSVSVVVNAKLKRHLFRCIRREYENNYKKFRLIAHYTTENGKRVKKYFPVEYLSELTDNDFSEFDISFAYFDNYDDIAIGDSYFDFCDTLVKNLNLTELQQQIYYLMVNGNGYKAIARQLGTDAKNTQKQIKKIRQKIINRYGYDELKKMFKLL